MTINEMIKNAKIAIPALEVTLSMSVDELNEAVRNAMSERFMAEVDEACGLCGVPRIEAREFAVDFIQNNVYGKNCLTATINLILNGAFSKKYQLDDFIHKLLWVHVITACIRNGYEMLGSKFIPTGMIG